MLFVLLFPVPQKAHWGHEQQWFAFDAPCDHQLPEPRAEGESLEGLAQAHVVAQHGATAPRYPMPLEPRQPDLLMWLG